VVKPGYSSITFNQHSDELPTLGQGPVKLTLRAHQPLTLVVISPVSSPHLSAGPIFAFKIQFAEYLSIFS